MNTALSLRSKVLLLAALNAVLLAGALVWFASTQLVQDVGSLLLGESRERTTAVALQIGNELPKTARAERDAMLARYSSAHGVTFRLFHLNGTQLGGPAVALPDALLEILREQRARTPLLERSEILSRLIQQSKEQPPEDSFRLGRPKLDRLLAVVEDPPVFAHADGNYWVVFRMPVRASDAELSELFQPGMLVLTTPNFFRTPFLFDLKPWLGLAAVVLLIALACWLPLVHGATRSIATLAAAAAKIAQGNFSAKVDVRRSDELGQLEHSFNRMAAQLEGYVHGQKRFLRDAAHELRSPLARMQAALGNIQESRFGPEVEPLLEDLREEIELMSSLTGELLSFAREENAQGKRILTPVNLPAMAARVLATENPGGAADVRVRIDAGLSVAAHPESLFRGLSNVVRNAIRYAGGAGPVTLVAEHRNGNTIVTVSDQGPGIPEEALEMIFTPFYRLDVSRDRKTGGNGLGMAIARSCVEACQGTIFCRNRHPGLEVNITLRTS